MKSSKMKHKFTFLTIIFIFLLIAVSCTQKSITEPEKQSLARLEPEQGFIGSLLKISNLDTSANRYNTRLYFPGLEHGHYADSIVDHIIYAHIPYGATSGQLKVIAGKDSVVFKNFKVLEDCPESVVVKWYNLPDPVTESNARYWDWAGYKPWKAEIKGDTIHFFVDGFCGDECHYWLDFKLKINEKKALPEFISLRYFSQDYYSGDEEYWLEQGLIKIQDYDPNSVISGRIFSVFFDYCNGLRFWYDFSKEQQNGE